MLNNYIIDFDHDKLHIPNFKIDMILSHVYTVIDYPYWSIDVPHSIIENKQ